MQLPLFAEILESETPPLTPEEALRMLRPLEAALLEDMNDGLRAGNEACTAAVQAGGGANAQAHAVMVNSCIQARLQHRLQENEEIFVQGGLGIRVRMGGFLLAVKKMVGGWFAFNETKQAYGDLRQANGPFLLLGYTLDFSGTEIREVRLVLPRNELEAWWSVPFDIDTRLEGDVAASSASPEEAANRKPQRGRNRIRGKGQGKQHRSGTDSDGKD